MTTKEGDIEAGDGSRAGTGGPQGGAAAGPAPGVVPPRGAGAAPGPAEPRAPAPVQPSPRGRGLALLALLCALAALAGTGYLYWVQEYGPDPLALRLAALEQRLGAVEATAGVPVTMDPVALRREADRIAAELRDELKAEFSVEGRPPSAGAAIPVPDPIAATTPREWQLAEARYLLRMANHRLLLERDTGGAIALLRSADDVLRAIDDIALYEARARIAAELLALEGLPVVDGEGLFLQLEAIKRDLDRLPLRLPELQPAPAVAVEPVHWWEAIRAELGKLVRFRQFEGAVRPLLAPEEAVYLELNLRLMLERAQLAGLRREQIIYEQSIGVATDWIERYLDIDAPEVRPVLDGLRALRGINLATPMPDISGSLAALDELRAGSGSGQ